MPKGGGMGMPKGGEMGMSEGAYVQRGGVYPRSHGIPTPLDMGYGIPLVLTPSGGHQNRCSLQAGGTHPTGMLSCL